MKKALASVALAAGLLSACVTAPIDHQVANTRTYPEGKDVVWEKVVGYFATNNVSIKTIEKASGIIAADRIYTGARTDIELAGFADCGKQPLTIPVRAVADLNVFVRTLPDGKTTVSVNTRYNETRRFGNYPPIEQSCTSTGKLENAILDGIG